MTNGIEIRDKVRIKASGEVGVVVGIDDHHDKYPADLNVMTDDGREEFPYGQSVHIRVRVDEVEKLP